jgi:hypothetical protein
MSAVDARQLQQNDVTMRAVTQFQAPNFGAIRNLILRSSSIFRYVAPMLKRSER